MSDSDNDNVPCFSLPVSSQIAHKNNDTLNDSFDFLDFDESVFDNPPPTPMPSPNENVDDEDLNFMFQTQTPMPLSTFNNEERGTSSANTADMPSTSDPVFSNNEPVASCSMPRKTKRKRIRVLEDDDDDEKDDEKNDNVRQKKEKKELPVTIKKEPMCDTQVEESTQAIDQNEAARYFGNMMSKLVTHKDLVTENFLREVIDSLPQRNDLSATELSRLWKDEARKRITQFSVTLSHKLSPLVQIMLDQKLSAALENTFVEVDTNQPSLNEMVKRYRKCFDVWIDDASSVSFRATNTRLLGKLDIKDVYILTFFTFCTCRRTRNDNILQLGLVGCSTSGKSTLFEACLMEGSHVTTNEQGVGRFQVGNKPVLMFHDIEIRTLAMSKDTEKIKTIARTEPTVTKIHSSTYTLQPLFLFYSSNERLMTHKFTESLPSQAFQWRHYQSQVNDSSIGNKKRATDENLAAIQNRFIEAFVRKPPKLDVNDLPTSGGFQRIHGILGMFPRIIALMKKYQPQDFFSPVLRQYVMHGLCSNFATYASVMLNDDNEDELGSQEDLQETLRDLINKHIDPSLQQSLLRFV